MLITYIIFKSTQNVFFSKCHKAEWVITLVKKGALWKITKSKRKKSQNRFRVWQIEQGKGLASWKE